MKTYKTEELIQNILYDIEWRRNGLNVMSEEYQGLRELRDHLQTAKFSKRTTELLDENGITYQVSNDSTPILRVLLSEEEALIRKYNTETLPYIVGQVHALIDLVFHKKWRTDDGIVTPFPSDSKGIYRAYFIILQLSDGFPFKAYLNSINVKQEDIEDILRIFGSWEGYQDAKDYMRHAYLSSIITDHLQNDIPCKRQVIREMGITEKDLMKKLAELHDYQFIDRLCEALCIDTSDSAIINGIHKQILKNNPEYFTTPAPTLILRYKHIFEK